MRSGNFPGLTIGAILAKHWANGIHFPLGSYGHWKERTKSYRNLSNIFIIDIKRVSEFLLILKELPQFNTFEKTSFPV